MITGTVSLVFAAIGLLSAGIIITIFKPPARYLAMWNIISSLFSVVGVMAYGYFSCTASSNALIMEKYKKFRANVDEILRLYFQFSSFISMQSKL